jgi:ABC-type phosphate transport system substrate-binding protein
MIPHRYGLAALLLLCVSLHAGAVEIVVNPSIKQQTLTLNTLRAIFSMRMTQWPDGTPIRVFVLGDKNPEHAAFSKQILGVFPHQLRRAWNRQIYSGTGQAPNKVDTTAEMRYQIEKTPGAIGYLPKEQINGHIRTIEIE